MELSALILMSIVIASHTGYICENKKSSDKQSLSEGRLISAVPPQIINIIYDINLVVAVTGEIRISLLLISGISSKMYSLLI